MTGRQQDTTSRLHLPDDMASSRGAENAILAYHEFLDAISNANLCNQLHHFGIVVSTIAANDKEGTLSSFWD